MVFSSMANISGRVCADLVDSLIVLVKIKRLIAIGVNSLALEDCLFTGQFEPLVKYTEVKNFSLITALNIGTDWAVVLPLVKIKNVVDHSNLVHQGLE
jgi:hypothetical protein